MTEPTRPSEGQPTQSGFEAKHLREQEAVHDSLDALRQKSTDEGVKTEAKSGKYESFDNYLKANPKAKEFMDQHPELAKMGKSFFEIIKKAMEGMEIVRDLLAQTFGSTTLEKFGGMFGGWLQALSYEVAKKGTPMFKDLLSDKSIVYKPKDLPSNFDSLTNAEEKAKIMEAASKKEMNAAAPKLESLYARINLKPHTGMPPSAFMQLVANVIREDTASPFNDLKKDAEEKRIFGADIVVKAAEKVLANANEDIKKQQELAKRTPPPAPPAAPTPPAPPVGLPK
jgi:hypothetical protein